MLSLQQAFLDRCNADLIGLTDLVQGELTEAERLTLGALITVDLHASDVVRELLEGGVKQTSDFEWVSRLRYYWRDDVFVDMAQVGMLQQACAHKFVRVAFLVAQPHLQLTH